MAMEVVTGAMGSLLPKLGTLLMKEYNLHKSVKLDIESLSREMKSMHAALLKVAEVPRDQLDEQVKLWADEIRELSYNMEDIVDNFMVHVDGLESTDNWSKFKLLMKNMDSLFKKGKTRRQIAAAIKDINKEVKKVATRRDMYTVDNTVLTPRAATIDPRLRAFYTQAIELVGIYGERDQEIIKLMSEGDDDISKAKLKTICIVGFGGLGKTTLARTVYDNIKQSFDCWAFVPVGRNPEVKKVFMNILIDLDKQKYTNINLTILDERQLIEELREFLWNKRYLVIIDDIWDEITWKDIKLGFSNRDKNLGSRIITTTRIVSVSKACCPSMNDKVYEMKPLSDHDSQMLFYRRVFSHKAACPEDFQQVSRGILKKCGGVPLAIITIASLLVKDQRVIPKEEWHVLLHSIGRRVTEDDNLDDMHRILLFSYYDLPFHLKTCLLYVSIYPEDWEIRKDQLIWKWLAESFVQCEKQEASLFEVGETYFNELINRGMVKPVYDDIGKVEACLVHDMVLDLIRSLSCEENFVVVLDGTADSMCPQSYARRLSLQNIEEGHQTSPLINSMSMSQVRSVTVFPPAFDWMRPLSSFDCLRILDLSGCNLGKSGNQVNLTGVGKLLHMRYLGLAETGICELPTEIGNLQFLQVLDVQGNPGLKHMPLTVYKLRKLMFLNVDKECKMLPDVLGNLTSIEVLKKIGGSLNMMRELGILARLRKLEICFSDETLEMEEAFVKSVCNLHNLQSISLSGKFGSMDMFGECWVPSRHLSIFDSYFAGVFSVLPAWIKGGPSQLSNLSDLRISVKEVQQEDVHILGRLPALRRLRVRSTHQTQQRLLLINGFQCLIEFQLYSMLAVQIVFEEGALPRAEAVGFNVGVRVAKYDGNGGFDLGLENLLSLREATVWIYHGGATAGDAKKAEAVIRRALKDHPNHPTIRLDMWPSIPEDAHDDDLCDN